MFATGQRVRHRKQPAWGIGRVIGAAQAAGMIELVIEFPSPTGQRHLKLKPEMAGAMIEVLSAEDTAALDGAVARREATRRAGLKSKKLAPRLHLETRCLCAVATGDGNALVAIEADDGARELRVYAPDGRVVETIEAPAAGQTGPFWPDRFVPERICAVGDGLFFGTRAHLWEAGVFVRRGEPTARMWRSPRELGGPNVMPLPGIGALLHDFHHVVIARPDGTASEVPLGLDGRTLGSAQAWGDGILLCTHGDAADSYAYAYIGHDGSVRHRGPGRHVEVVDDDLMIAFDDHGVQSRHRDGSVAGRLEAYVSRPFSMGFESAFARVDDELVFTRGNGDGLVRWHPRVDGPRWTTPASPEIAEGLRIAVRAGRFLAVPQRAYAEDATPRVWLVDAETGAYVTGLEVREAPDELVPVGDDALVARMDTGQLVAWRGLGRPKPERFTLSLPSGCSTVVALAARTILTNESFGVSFVDL